jgi:hypothetical protein
VLPLPAAPPKGWPLAPAAPRDAARIDIVSPGEDTHLLHKPDEPPEADILALRAALTGPIRTIAWYVDGHLFSTVRLGEPTALGRCRQASTASRRGCRAGRRVRRW